MRIGSLQIRQSYAQLGMETERGGFQMRQPLADLSIRQPSAEMAITFHHARVIIDQSACWVDIGLAGWADFNAAQAEENKAAALEGIGQIAQDGDRMLLQHNAIPAIATDACKRCDLEIDVDVAPKHMPKIDFVDAEPPVIDIQLRPPEIDVQLRPPEFNYRRNVIRTYVAQRESLKFWYEPMLDARV